MRRPSTSTQAPQLDQRQLQQNFFAFTVEEVASLLGTNLEDGLGEEEARVRLARNGKNSIKKETHLAWLKILFRQFLNPLIFILIVAGVVTFFMEEWIDTVIIFLAIGVNAALGFYQEYKAENALSHLRSYIQERTRVVRDGKEFEIDASLVVVGDIIHVTAGARVPADARLCRTNQLRVNESVLTGESSPELKDEAPVATSVVLADRTSMLYGGTLVVGGSGTAVVTATAMHTQIGRIAHLVTQTQQERTPLQKAVTRLAWLIALFVSLLVIGIFVLGIVRGVPVLEMFIMAVAIAVSAIPEALPIGLTAVLAVGVEQIAKKKGIIRNLSAAETLGSTTVIMTDKTGTLTQANMQLVAIATKVDLASKQALDTQQGAVHSFTQEQKDVLALASINTDVLVENPEDDPMLWRMTGNLFEMNIIRSCAQLGIDVPQMRQGGQFKNTLLFNSKNKFSVSTGKLSLGADIAGKKGSHVRVILGAPDILLKRAHLELNEYLSYKEQIEALSESGKRLLGVAVQHITQEEAAAESIENIEVITDVDFVGLLSFYDPIRESVPQAIQKIEARGVHVVMATGDLRGTAVAVARDLGWDIETRNVLGGDELKQMTDDELREALDVVRVFARVTPEDKLRIGRLYKERGEVVAMTGDGVNDAPALKAVDIGIAVGSGSDVAKGVADLVLLDDNFEVIVGAIEEGKRMLRNIRKTFVYLMSNSLNEVILIGGSLLLGFPLPLSAIQIIWVNFVTESLPAVAFAFDTTDKDTKSSEEDTEVLNGEVKFLTLGIGALTSVLLFALYYVLLIRGIDQAIISTFLFACFSSYILVVAFSLRSLNRPLFSYNIFSNRLLVIGVGIGLLLLIATIYVPFLQNIFNTVALSPAWLLFVVLWSVFNVALVECAKWIFYRRKKI